MYQFESKEHMLAYLKEWDLDGLDSDAYFGLSGQLFRYRPTI